MKVLVVAGARPNFMKVAPILAELRRREHVTLLVHTGQHYDAAMSDAFFRDLDMTPPDHHLEVGAGSHAEQTARVMERFDDVLVAERPDWVVVVGDVNSTVATALVTAKRRPELGCRLAHVEAGLRSGDWRMPEEVNRVVTDQLSDLLLTHSPEADGHLAAEGIDPVRVEFVGNVMIDSLFATVERARADAPWREHGLQANAYGLVTLHRPSNVDDPERLKALVEGLGIASQRLPLIWPVHPRARARLDALGLTIPPLLRLTDPLGYCEMAGMLDGAAVVITDSGGLQEESTALGVPCVTLRESTERPVTVTDGTNRMVPWPPTADRIVATVTAALSTGRGPGSRAGRPVGWDGSAANRIVDALEQAPLEHARCPLPEAVVDALSGA
ncbi:MAG: UDP-N-acetylglucosamine 2-epimerase (non-hydrolyzing) [Gemmatimonadales bacterium]